ncbi:relaxase domain-containing protein [Streptomyces sp. EN27]|uniref:relaxase domain-containing protein n=1 Tax=Streptomyces sp. EN27 TaxID=211464 RepID=UPI000B28F75D|nr:relaxase domain-containing protein [Streptomyces sp. EN27]
MIEAAHEYAIVRVLEWIEDEVAVIRYGKDGNYRVRPPGGLVAARFRHYEARSGRPLLHDHLLLSVKGQRLDGKWGSIHTTALHENTVAASALYNECDGSVIFRGLGCSGLVFRLWGWDSGRGEVVAFRVMSVVWGRVRFGCSGA